MAFQTTLAIGSVGHTFGPQRFDTGDSSRNNLILGIVALGDGWHNNHHHYQSSANQGFFWWELDISYAILRALSWVGLVWDLRKPSDKALKHNLLSKWPRPTPPNNQVQKR